MNEKIENIEKNGLITFETSYGLSPMPGWSKYIVTKDKKLYTFEYHHMITSFMEKNNIPKESSFEYEITNEQYEEIEKFIEDNITGKSFEPIFMTDASFKIKGEGFNIINYVELYNDGFEIIEKIINEKRK